MKRPMRAAATLARLLLAIVILSVGPLLCAPAVDAKITKVQITVHENPTFGGYEWPGVGKYEKIVGRAFGELDPANPQNAVIVDLALADIAATPTSPGKLPNGRIQYAFDFYILKPVDLSRGNHKMMYEPPNRGRKTWNTFGRVPAGNDPGTTILDPDVLANSFLMPRGYTIVWSGWDASAAPGGGSLTIGLPVARNASADITGPAYEYIVTSGTGAFLLTYPAATLDKNQALLTHRVRLNDPPTPVPASGWTYNATGTSINLVPAGWVANDIYEFSYTAKNPTVNGIGFAAVRDWVAWLRYETDDGQGTANPVAGDIQRVVTEVVSQPGRFLNDFRHLGFNQAENGRMVFDGLMQWISAGDGINMNYRWSQPGRTERNRQDHLYAEGVFPFANVTTTDPFTHKTDSRLARCEATHTCPVAAEIYSANEYWVKAASLLHTTPDGTVDLTDSPFSRIYFISSHQHGTGNKNSKGVCQQFQNPLDSAPIQRALWVAIDEWLDGTPPPASRIPTLAGGTLAPPLPQAGMGFPNIPGVTYNGLKTTRYLFDYGPDYYTSGIPTINPPAVTPPYQDNPLNGPIYPSFIPITDRDGNDIAGIRLPDVTVPLATYTGWALRAGPQAGDGCEAAGQYIPFAETKAERLATGDPRLSVEERYPSFAEYYSAVKRAIDGLIKDRLMLCEDAAAEQARLIQAGLDAGVPAPKGNLPPQPTTAHCRGNGK
jgi:Alpha/beta hydrolase domain